MYRVILIDDEEWTLKNLRRLLAWREYGFHVEGAFQDSAAALNWIGENCPDVVFTDIRMPGLNGLELIRGAKERISGPLYVIVSGYASFSYAQEALRQGAVDYLVKPVDTEEGDRLLLKLKGLLEKRSIERDNAVIDGLADEATDLTELLRRAGFRTEGTHWLAVGFAGLGERIEAAEEFLRGEGLKPFPFRLGPSKLVLLLGGGHALKEQTVAALSRWTEDAAIGLSTLTEDRKLLRNIIREADQAAHTSFVRPPARIEYFRREDGAFTAAVVSALEKHWMERDWEALSRMLARLPEKYAVAGLGVYHAADLWNAFVAAMRRRLPALAALERAAFMGYREMLARYASFAELCAEIADIFAELRAAEEEAPIRYVNTGFHALLRDVQNRYHEKLSITELSRKHFLNTSYCCELFKRETGGTFSEYVLRIRMEKARELLSSTDESIAQVAGRVGYPDYYYFCKSFRRYYGASPSKYREKSLPE